MAGRGRRLLAPALVIAALCGTALLTPLTGRTSSADAALGAPYTGQLGMMPSCFLPSAAFCDTFSEGPYTGSAVNRGGDLDPAKWSFSRLTEQENPGQGDYFAYPPATAQFCQTPLPGVLPPRDSFMCNGTNGQTTQFQGTEDMHWMTTIDDGGVYAANGARILQPFDFSGRTGTVAFMVDAVTRGAHSFWPGVVLADQPVNDPHESKPGVNAPPRNGVEIDFNSGCNQPDATTDAPQTTVGQVSLFTNYAETDLNPQALGLLPCVQTQRDHPNLILIQYSQTSLDVWMADDIANMQPGTPMMAPTPKHVLHMDQSSGFSLPFTRGYLSFQHAHYNAEKFNGESTMTYHWHAIGFDGPALPADRDYEVPDAGGPVTLSYDGVTGTGQNIGYAVNGTTISACCANVYASPIAQPFVLKNVDLTGATSAAVTFDWREDSNVNPGLQVRVNGKAWHDAIIPPTGGSFTATSAIAPIPVSELQSGNNTLEFNAPNGVTIANIDLALDPTSDDAVSTTTSTSSSLMTTTSTASTSSMATGSTSSGSSSTSSMGMGSTSSLATGSTSTAASTVTSQTHQASTTAMSSTTTSVAHSTTTSVAHSTTASATSTSVAATSSAATSTSRSASSTSTSASTSSVASAPTFRTWGTQSHYMQWAGGTLTFTASVQDLTGSLSNGVVAIAVVGPDGATVSTQLASVQQLSAGQTQSYRFTVSAPHTPGKYTLRIAVYGQNETPLYSVNDHAGSLVVI